MRNWQPLILRSGAHPSRPSGSEAVANSAMKRRVSKDAAPNHPRPHIPATRCARVIPVSFAPKRAWGMPGGKRTRSLVWKKITHELVTTVAPVHPAFPHANGFNGFLRSLPGDRLFVSVVPGKRQLLKNLVPASGYQDATTSPSASRAIRQRRQSVHRIPRPTSVTIAKRPSFKGAGRRGYGFDLGKTRSDLFLQR